MFGRNKKIAARYAAIRQGIVDGRYEAEKSRDPHHYSSPFRVWPTFETSEETQLYHRAFRKMLLKEMIAVVSRIEANFVKARTMGLLRDGD